MPRPIHRHAPLEVKEWNVEVEVKGQVAVTKTRQLFHNPSAQRLEGTFIFPVPKGAHVEKFSMEVNGKMQEAELLDADKARKLYEDIVRKARDPALFEYAGQALYKVRIFPIEPRADKEVRLRYVQILPKDGNLARYHYQLDLTKYSPKPIGTFSFKAEIDGGDNVVKTVYSPSHEVEIKRKGKNKVLVGMEEKDLAAKENLLLYFGLKGRGGEAVTLDLLAHRPDKDADGYFLLLVSPPAWDEIEGYEEPPKDVVFVLDSSGSMRKGKLEQAKKALDFCIDGLNPKDRFEVVRFSTEAEGAFGGLRTASAKAKKQADAFLEDIRAVGGTAIDEALEVAAEVLAEKADKARPAQVVFLTDGRPTVGPVDEKVILDRLGKRLDKVKAKIRVFCLGIGHDVNAHLLDRLVEKTGSAGEYALPEEDLEVKISRFYEKIARPVLSDLELEIDGPERVRKIYPRDLPDLFKGEQLVALGRYESGEDESVVKLSGSIAGKKVTYKLDASFPDKSKKNEFIPRLWAMRRVGYLLDEVRLRGETKELRDEITGLARKFGIVTPYTSYLILEDEERRGVPVARRSLPGGRTHFFSGPVTESLDSLAAPAPILKMEAERYLREKSGEAAVRGAASGLALKEAGGLADLAKAKSLAYSRTNNGRDDEAGLAFETTGPDSRIVEGKTFHRAGEVWIDDEARDDKDLEVEEVEFGSKEYFDLLAKDARLASWLSVGAQIDVFSEGKLYRVR